MTLISRLLLVGATSAFTASASQSQDAPPAHMLGALVDDYGNRYDVSKAEWRQGPKAVYHILKWNVKEQYLVLHNAPENTSNPDRFSRIDLVQFTEQGEYTWGYCYTAYKAATSEEAEATTPADRGNPKKGCNGFPFSRMKPRQ